MPSLDAGAYLINILFEVGPAKPLSMGGLVSVDEADIVAWQINRDLRLSAWEAKTIRRLSQVYCNECSEARSPTAPAPYVASPSTITATQRERISRAMSDWADKVNGKRAGQ